MHPRDSRRSLAPLRSLSHALDLIALVMRLFFTTTLLRGRICDPSFRCSEASPPFMLMLIQLCIVVVVVVVVVVDSHIQRIVLATEETTVTQQVSHRPIKCQSRLWSQRGTKVNGSHHGDNPLLRPTGIQIATKSYAALQAMAPTNIKTVHQTSLLHIESNLDRL